MPPIKKSIKVRMAHIVKARTGDNKRAKIKIYEDDDSFDCEDDDDYDYDYDYDDDGMDEEADD